MDYAEKGGDSQKNVPCCHYPICIVSFCGPSNAGWEQVKVGVNIKTDDISLISCGTIQEEIVCRRNSDSVFPRVPARMQDLLIEV